MNHLVQKQQSLNSNGHLPLTHCPSTGMEVHNLSFTESFQNMSVIAASQEHACDLHIQGEAPPSKGNQNLPCAELSQLYPSRGWPKSEQFVLAWERLCLSSMPTEIKVRVSILIRQYWREKPSLKHSLSNYSLSMANNTCVPNPTFQKIFYNR